jgi:DNA-binding transcriptional ArsR family regulator
MRTLPVVSLDVVVRSQATGSAHLVDRDSLETILHGVLELHVSGMTMFPDPGITSVDPDLAERQLGWDNPAQVRSPANLLGRTRASVLTSIAESPHLTTKELASLLGISPAGASQHATVLREAGLITTRREGGAALRILATAGFALLDQPEPPPDVLRSGNALKVT